MGSTGGTDFVKLGISSYTYGWAVGVEGHRPSEPVSALDLLRRAKQLGIRVVQLCDNLPAETFDDASISDLLAVARGAAISLELGISGTQPDHLRRFAQLAATLASPILRVVIDTPGDHPDVAEVVRRIAHALPAFESDGVTLAIENHDRFKSRVLCGILRDLASPNVGICLDTVNSFGALEGPDVVIDALGPHVVNLHCKDFTVQRLQHQQGFIIEGRPAGQGMLDIPSLLSRLRTFGRDQNVILEQWTPPEASMESTLEKENRWADEGIKALRQWIRD